MAGRLKLVLASGSPRRMASDRSRSVTLGLFEGAKAVLKPGGQIFLYSPYKVNGEHTAPSNAEFDRWLKDKNPDFGVRDIAAVQKVAASHGIAHQTSIPMPANNFIQVFSLPS